MNLFSVFYNNLFKSPLLRVFTGKYSDEDYRIAIDITNQGDNHAIQKKH